MKNVVNRKQALFSLLMVVILSFMAMFPVMAAVAPDGPAPRASTPVIAVAADEEVIEKEEQRAFMIGDIVLFSGSAYSSSDGAMPRMSSTFGIFQIRMIHNGNHGSLYPFGITPVGRSAVTGFTDGWSISLLEACATGYVFQADRALNIRRKPNLGGEIFTRLAARAFITIFDFIVEEERVWGVTYNGFYVAMENLTMADNDCERLSAGWYTAVRNTRVRDATTAFSRNAGILRSGQRTRVLHVFYSEDGVRHGRTRFNGELNYVRMEDFTL
jgi:hypothetical protein